MQELRYILGIDWGQKKIGLAIADSVSQVATPFAVVPTLAEVLKIIEQEQIDELVIGRPQFLNGDDANDSEGFAYFLAQLKNSGLDVHLVDERLTSKQADVLARQSLGGGGAGNKKEKADQDAIAAMIILQSWLDRYGRDAS